MTTIIRSLNNQRIKDVVKLSKRNQRDRRRITVVEGLRETHLALKVGIIPTEAYICSPLLFQQADANANTQDQDDGTDLPQTAILELHNTLTQLAQRHQFPLLEVTPEVYAKIAYRTQSGGILLVIPYIHTSLLQLSPPANAFYLIIEGVEKPGNLGAILRTADAAGVDGVIVCAGGTDIHNPNVIRASLGALFTVPVVEAPPTQTLDWLRQHKLNIVVTSPDVQWRYTDIDLTGPVAIVMGSESTGVTDMWFQAAHQQVCIPMYGHTNSLNLATSTALLLYETIRQRHQPQQKTYPC